MKLPMILAGALLLPTVAFAQETPAPATPDSQTMSPQDPMAQTPGDTAKKDKKNKTRDYSRSRAPSDANTPPSDPNAPPSSPSVPGDPAAPSNPATDPSNTTPTTPPQR